MQVKDILILSEQHIDVDRQDKTWRGKFDPIRFEPSSRRQKLGSGEMTGLYSKVKDKGGDPHVVKKRSKDHVMAKTDPYWFFIDYIIDNDLMDNPYFPKIYKKRRIEDVEGKKMYSLEMEKLFPLHNLSEKEIIAIASRIFSKSFINGELKELSNNIHESFFMAMRGLMNDTIDIDEVKDKNLIEAIKTVQLLDKRLNRRSIDISGNNIMVRRSPVGSQIVITDPLG